MAVAEKIDPEMESSSVSDSDQDVNTKAVVRRHMLLGWGALLAFLSMGMMLEAMHGLKIGFLVDADNSTRRLMWTLSHAHGTLVAIVNIIFAVTVSGFPQLANARLQINSLSLAGATILLPGGFFLAGLKIYAGDPGFGIFVVPVGAALLFISVLLTALPFLKSEPSLR